MIVCEEIPPGFADAWPIVAGALSDGIRPIERVPFSAWLQQNIELIDGPQTGELWNARGAPYLPEIADCLSDDHPCNLVTVEKSQQTGASILALGWCLYVADREPANMLYGVPGIEALKALNNTKFKPLCDAFHKRIKRTVILPQTARSGEGSTTYEKRFAGGFLAFANANSVMDLSMITCRKGVKDEVSKWEDIPGYGDPEKLFFGRFTAHRRTRDYKILEISTPEVDSGLDDLDDVEGHCRINRSFLKSDRRYWNCVCPECGQLFVHTFDRLLIDNKHPHRSRYSCTCGHEISEAERVVAVRAGEWIAAMPGEDRHPGFHIDAFLSMMMTYGDIAQDHIDAKTETAKKAFHNLVLGLPYKYGGDAPDHVRLMERREPDLVRGQVPPRGLILTAFADVQMRGLWVEIVAHASNREKWVVDAFYIDGDTSSVNAKAFEDLKSAVLDREFPDAFGGKRRIDALAIDSGYRSHVVYAFVRNNQRIHPMTGHDIVLATKGMKGWGRPAIGTPTLVDVDLGGRRISQGCKVWPLGTWPLKSTHYTELHIEKKPDDLIYPDGYRHHGGWLDDVYFKQLTAESLQDIRFKGRVTGRKWVRNGDNHFLDCAVGNEALFEYLGGSITTPEQWAKLAVLRGLPPDLSRADLFTPKRAETVDPANAAGAIEARKNAERKPETKEPDRGWLDGYKVDF